jgi:cyclohexa-1,5-dienecarbonyl-CoA hydratase
MTAALEVRVLEDGSLLHCTLARPKANILDRSMIAELRAELLALRDPALKTILFSGAGSNFSCGASVEEHRAETVAAMLPEFHALFRELADSNRILVAAVQGWCLGGGLELAAFCHHVVAAPGAKFGNPEVNLGVFAPIASIVLPRRVAGAAADDLLVTGRTMEASEALRIGLADELADDPLAAAIEWHRQHIAPKSATALAFASASARRRLHADLKRPLEKLERLYLEKLMATHDAREGIEAFIARRSPQWTHR